ncbi:MAG: PrsW family glutamic-type intramembrane protease [Candidatus Vogelbacteria bacterium]|nr:PrsW family glutamic-type intramembrane protease [Candidatus Vogelbacteria bacterium]
MVFVPTFKSIFFLVIGGLLPSLIWLWFWLKEDRSKPEPKSLVVETFLLGGLGVFLAFYLERFAVQGFDLGLLETVKIDFYSWSGALAQMWPILSVFFSWALIEEFVKYLAALLLAFHSKAFDEPIDAMIYMISAALGFAAIENSLFLHKTLSMGLSGFDFLMNGNLRFLGATLLHVFSSALLGAFIAMSLRDTGIKRLLKIVIGVLTASLLHALFNFFIIVSGGDSIFIILIALWIFTLLIFVLFEKIKKLNFPYVQR